MFLILLIILYSAAFCFLITKSSYFQIKELTVTFICGVFVLKILMGILYGHIHNVYFGGVDTFDYFNASAEIAHSFFKYPYYYLQSWLLMNPSVPDGSNVFVYPEWRYIEKDFGTYLLIHIHALPQLFAFGSYNVHIVFVAMLGLFASLNFYRALKDAMQIPQQLLVFTSFFMPSVIFWTAGLHKDVWIYFGISLVLLSLSKFTVRKTLPLLELFLGMLIIALFRYYLIPILFPAIIAFVWSVYRPNNSPLYKFSLVYLVLLCFVVLLEMTGSYPIMNLVAERQQEFLNEPGSSAIKGISPMEPTFIGLLSSLPQAVFNVCFRPFLWDCKDLLQGIAAVEIILFWIVALFTLPFRRVTSPSNPMSYFLFFYAVGNLLLIGLLVSNVGTIVRYRAIALAFLSVVILQAYHYIRIGLKQRQNLISGKNAMHRKKAGTV
jgi:hypothetical protein